MNHPTHIPPGTPTHPHYSQRQRDYHAYHGPPPHSPHHHNPYAATYYPPPPQYYNPQAHQYGQQQRWPPQQHMQYPQQFPPYMMTHPYAQHPSMGVPPRPVMNGQPMTPNQRQHPLPYSQHVHPGMHQAPSSPPAQPPTPSAFPSLAASTDTGLPSPAATPERDDARQNEQVETKEDSKDTSATANGPQEAIASEDRSHPLQLPAEWRTPFYPQLPWYSPSTSSAAFPPRAISRRKKRSALHSANDVVALPSRDQAVDTPALSSTPEPPERVQLAEDVASEVSTVAAPSDAETPATSHAPSETDCAQVSTPTTPGPPVDTSPKPTPTQAQHARRDTRSAVAIPNISSVPRHKGTPSTDRQTQTKTTPQHPDGASEPVSDAQDQATSLEEVIITKPAAPKSWADLVRIKGAAAKSSSGSDTVINGVATLPKNATLAEALRQYIVQSGQISFIEPRGLVNTGNMCYMNSILQVLVFCMPFYNFLDQVRSRTVHSIKSETPLLDAMIMFMRELKVIASADSVDTLRKTLKADQLEKYGDPITPEYIYDAIKHLPRFQSMRRGHQQDAEEFLGFVLEGLHDECVAVMQGEQKSPENGASDAGESEQQEADGWLEVGPKQKASVTRTAGQQDVPSPVTKIFGGHLRSELRVPGQKDSVTLEPYKPLQLDIGAPNINNIVDALKGLTRTENLTGDFGGRGNTAKKQVFIDSLPPVLILHLKRFQYENNLTGTQKIWKKVGYPLELEIPKEVLPQSKRASLAVGNGLPKYRLTSVVYHHGKSAAGGHYTVDVLRQDFREWVRIDDTFIRRIRPEDVAEGGAEEDPKILAKALEQHKAAQELQKQRNMYEGLDDDEHADEHAKPWNEVNGIDKKSKGVTGAVSAGMATPSSTTGKRTPVTKGGVKDNKVAYILLYERIDG